MGLASLGVEEKVTGTKNGEPKPPVSIGLVVPIPPFRIHTTFTCRAPSKAKGTTASARWAQMSGFLNQMKLLYGKKQKPTKPTAQERVTRRPNLEEGCWPNRKNNNAAVIQFMARLRAKLGSMLLVQFNW